MSGGDSTSGQQAQQFFALRMVNEESGEERWLHQDTSMQQVK